MERGEGLWEAQIWVWSLDKREMDEDILEGEDDVER